MARVAAMGQRGVMLIWGSILASQAQPQDRDPRCTSQGSHVLVPACPLVKKKIN